MILQRLGFEVRKIGSLEDVYKEVDLVMSKIPNNFLAQTVAHTLQDMFQPNKYICICTIDKIIKAAGIFIPQDRYNVYSMLHCVHWSEMEPNYRTTIMAMILDDFRCILKPETKGELKC